MSYNGFNFNNTYSRLPEEFYTKLLPVSVRSPELIILNEALSVEMGIDFSDMTSDKQSAIFSGNVLPDDAEPLAQAYAGHQFGHFSILGDGRAIIWGEHITPDGKCFDIQFKGSGRTPYSRGGDGRAALGPMLREYIISEAMHWLNIPTTRSLAVVTTGEMVYRETPLPGAILTRVASSHIRVGTFEYAAAHRNKFLVQTMLDYTIGRHYLDLKDADNKALELLKAVMDRQINLIVEWMRVGFIHGVMNTDNMALSGETIDYGPCAFMDAYDPSTVFSSIDHMGRYSFANQRVIAQWNLTRFAETLLPLLDTDKDRAIAMAEGELNGFKSLFEDKWLSMMRSKIGLFGEDTGDKKLISDLLDWMHRVGADYTNTFLDLGTENYQFKGKLYASKEFKNWYARWQKRILHNPEPLQSSFHLMGANNPAVIPRNNKVEQALELAGNNDLKPLHALLNALKEPYKNRPDIKEYQSPPAPGGEVYQTFCGT